MIHTTVVATAAGTEVGITVTKTEIAEEEVKTDREILVGEDEDAVVDEAAAEVEVEIEGRSGMVLRPSSGELIRCLTFDVRC